MTDIRKQIEATLERGECASDKTQADAAFREAIKLFEPRRLEQLDGYLAYLLGYAWYNLPEDTPERTAQVEKTLCYAITQAPDNYYAVLYLGHHLFDCGRYEEALRQFLKIPAGYFTHKGQAWRDLKLLELMICCFLYTQKSKEAVETLGHLIEGSCKVTDIDRPAMSELRMAFETILRSKRQ